MRPECDHITNPNGELEKFEDEAKILVGCQAVLWCTKTRTQFKDKLLSGCTGLVIKPGRLTPAEEYAPRSWSESNLRGLSHRCLPQQSMPPYEH
jgi:hypothetical protein